MFSKNVHTHRPRLFNLLTDYNLKFLHLKGGCTGSPESTHAKMSHCCKSHVLAHLLFNRCRVFLNSNITFVYHNLTLTVFSFHSFIMHESIQCMLVLFLNSNMCFLSKEVSEYDQEIPLYFYRDLDSFYAFYRYSHASKRFVKVYTLTVL